MIDLSRYKGLLAVGAGVLCAILFCNTTMLMTLGSDPALFSNPDRQLAWSQMERSGAQVAGVELQMRRQGLDRQPPFGVVLGQSTALRGIDPGILEQQHDPNTPWLLLNGFGGSFVKLNYYAQPLLASHLRPRVIVLALHETMLAGQGTNNNTAQQGKTKPNTGQARRRLGLKRQLKRAITLHWVRRQRANVSHFTSMALFDLRLSMHASLDLGAVGLFHPSAEPWQAIERKELPLWQEDRLKQQYENWQAFGWFNPDTYSTTNPHADAFRKLIADTDKLGAPQVVIVLMPVTSDLRGWLPPQAHQRMTELIDEVSVGRTIRVIDLRDAMPDDAFADYAHLSPVGREAFSSLLAMRLNTPNP
jgi:hypothetical protein